MNYYEILKVSQTASEQQIKNSYKKLVKQYHPDLYVGDKNFAEQKIKEINEAYEILSNPEKKSEYDTYLNQINRPKITYSSPVSHTPTNTPPQNPEPVWSFSKWITEKINQLDKKKQLQIFILILIVLLALFLINLIQVNYYLNNNLKNPSSNTTKTNPSNSTTLEDPLNQPNDFELLDDLFYDLFTSQDFYSEFENSF